MPPRTVHRRFAPKLCFDPVNPRVTRRYVLNALALSGFGGAGIVPSIMDLWERVPWLADQAQVEVHIDQIQELFTFSLVLSILGLVLLVIIQMGLSNSQLVLSLSRYLILTSLIFIIAALMLFFPNVIHIPLMAIVLLIIGVHSFLFGKLKYYWEQRSFGDAFLELGVIGVFVGMVYWKPVLILFVQ